MISSILEVMLSHNCFTETPSESSPDSLTITEAIKRDEFSEGLSCSSAKWWILSSLDVLFTSILSFPKVKSYFAPGVLCHADRRIFGFLECAMINSSAHSPWIFFLGGLLSSVKIVIRDSISIDSDYLLVMERCPSDDVDHCKYSYLKFYEGAIGEDNV